MLGNKSVRRHSFGSKLSRDFHLIGGKVSHVVSEVDDALERKVLPTIERGSRIADKFLELATPASAFIAPEFTPALIGARIANKGLLKTTVGIEKTLGRSQKLVSNVKEGNILGALDQAIVIGKNPLGRR